MSGVPRLAALVLSGAMLPLAPLGAGAAEAPSFEKCDGLVRRDPATIDSYFCYVMVARSLGRTTEAEGRLRGLMDADPANPRPLLYLALLADGRGDPAAEAMYGEAIAAMDGIADPMGQVRARQGLVMLLLSQGRHAEAASHLDAFLGAAERTGDHVAVLIARTWRAKTAYNAGDFGLAWSLFRQVESAVFPTGPAEVQYLVLDGLGAVATSTGRHRDALDYYRRAIAYHVGSGNAYEEAIARFNVALVASRPDVAELFSDQERLEMYRQALDASVRGRNQVTEASVRLSIAQFEHLSRRERLAEAEAALALSRRLARLDNLCFALRLLALYRSRWEPDAPGAPHMKLLDEAIRLARARGSLHHLARGHLVASMIAYERGDRDLGHREGLVALDAIEKIRDLQPDASVRIGVFSQWAYAYRRLAGYVLATAGDDPGAEDLEAAFSVSERLRARSLLDLQDATGAMRSAETAHDLSSRRDDLLARIAASQRRLIDTSLPDPAREQELEALSALEDEEATLRDAIARADPRFATLRRPAFPDLDDVRAALAPDEAMLYFQVGARDPTGISLGDGGSWVFVVTPSSARALPVPDLAMLQASVPAFIGLINRRDGSEAQAAVALHRDLLDPALRELPDATTKLILVPDSVLHRLPFGALRAAAGAEPLAAHYRISVAPSATLWMHWRQLVEADASVPALVLADPPLRPGRPDVEDARSGAPLLHGPALPPLPGARREARSLVATLGGGSRLLEGHQATESALKQDDLSRYRLVHLATHAVVDDARPARSAVVLAPGAPGEDGLLQHREIVRLDLRGRMVMLSGCSSSSGALVDGEGLMSLAHAFFQAGARTVVGSLLPQRDEDATRLVVSFSRNIAGGLDARTALAEAQRAMIHAGFPTAAWAGFVVMGDGGMTVLPGGVPGRPAGFPWWIVLPAGMIFAVAAAILAASRRGRD